LQKATDFDAPAFSKLSWKDLKILTIGVYQFNVAEGNTKEHHDGPHYEIFLHKEAPNLIKAKCQSRFQFSVIDTVSVEYKKQDGLSGIVGYVCDCMTGNRNLGCCGHVASVSSVVAKIFTELLTHDSFFACLLRCLDFSLPIAISQSLRKENADL